MSQVRVRCKVRGIAVEYAGDEKFFERWVDPLLSAAARTNGVAHEPAVEENGVEAVAPPAPPPAAPAGRSADAPTGYRPPSHDFGHFVRQLGPEAGEPDRQVVAFAFFLWNYEKKEEFHEDEVAGCFRALGLAAPANGEDIYRDLSERKRFLDPGAAEHHWRLTQKGRNYVKTRLFAGA